MHARPRRVAYIQGTSMGGRTRNEGAAAARAQMRWRASERRGTT
jgi:hypothetical protein